MNKVAAISFKKKKNFSLSSSLKVPTFIRHICFTRALLPKARSEVLMPHRYNSHTYSPFSPKTLLFKYGT